MTTITTTQTQLVRVFTGQIGGVTGNVCDGRELHAYLKNGERFAGWIKQRIEKYGFEAGRDFQSFSGKTEKPQAGRPGTDYHLSLDMAKELAMVENNEQGRAARRYFIDMERQALGVAPAPATNDALPSPAEAATLNLAYADRRLRILTLDGQPWFVAAEIALALGLRDSHVILRRVPAHHRQKHMLGKQLLNIIKLPALRQAILMAKPQHAQPFSQWLEQALKFEVPAALPAPAQAPAAADPASLLRGMLAGNRFMCLLDGEGRITLREIPQDHITIAVGQIPNWIADPCGARQEQLPKILQAVGQRLGGGRA